MSLVFITQSYFSASKDVRLNSTRYFIMKINNRKELQNNAISHSADIDYKDFMKIYREYIKELYSFLTINTTLPASSSLRFTDQIKILYNKIKQNEAQYNSEKVAAIISASSSSSKDLVDKCEYLTDKDLGLKPSTVEQAKFEHYPLGKVFAKGLNKDDQKDRLFKRLKNI